MSQSFMLNLKNDHLILSEFPFLFSIGKLKLGHNFSQYPLNQNLDFEVSVMGCAYFQIFPNS